MLYNPRLVHKTVKQALLLLLLAQPARWVVEGTLDRIYWELVGHPDVHFPYPEVYVWFTGGEPLPTILPEPRYQPPDHRGTHYAFWSTLAGHTYGPPQPRVLDGPGTPNLDSRILHLLTQIPFVQALETWYAVCEAYLQVCTITWYVEDVQRYPQLHLWKPGEEDKIPNYLAGMMALIYF